MSTEHEGCTIPTDEKIAVANALEAQVQAVIAPIVAQYVAQNACPCCIGRTIAGALVKLVGYHAAAAIVSPDDVERFLQMVAAAVGLGQTQRLAERYGVTDDSLEHMPVAGKPS